MSTSSVLLYRKVKPHDTSFNRLVPASAWNQPGGKVKILGYLWQLVCVLLLWTPSLGRRYDPPPPTYMNVIHPNGGPVKALQHHTSLTTTLDLILSTLSTTIIPVPVKLYTPLLITPTPPHYCYTLKSPPLPCRPEGVKLPVIRILQTAPPLCYLPSSSSH